MRAAVLGTPLAALLGTACTVEGYRPGAFDPGFRPPVGTTIQAPGTPAGQPSDVPGEETTRPSPQPQPTTPLGLDEVLRSVTERYPPWLSVLLERDLASGRLLQANANFDPMVAAKLGGQLQGFYEGTTLEAMIEQPLTTGDVIYGGYRISDGLLPDYDKRRTQDDGELVLGGRLPLLRDRNIDRRRAAVRQAQIDVELADPTIARARIDFVRAATRTYYGWVAAGRRLKVALELLQLATGRSADLQRAVDRQFLAAIDVTDNDRLIAQRRVFVVRAERQLQQAALELSLFLRDPADHPIVPTSARLPAGMLGLGTPAPPDPAALQADLEVAIRQRPELRRFQLQIDRVDTDRRLAENQTMPNLDVVVEASHSLSDDPYKDPNQTELFVGGELKLPLRQSDAYGRLAQANAALGRLRIDERFARDRVVNEIVDLRSALQATFDQIAATARNVELARQLVAAERRSFELGRSDLFRIQQRELQLADAQVLEVEASLEYHRAHADYRAALGSDGMPAAAAGR